MADTSGKAATTAKRPKPTTSAKPDAGNISGAGNAPNVNTGSNASIDGNQSADSSATSIPGGAINGTGNAPIDGGNKPNESAGKTGSIPAADKQRTRPVGRPPKDENAANLGVKLDAEKLGNQITGIHQMIALFTKQADLAITPQEGKMLALAIIDVSQQYAVNINPKTLAWFNLFGAAAAIYAPKAIKFVLTQPRKQKQAPIITPAAENLATTVTDISTGKPLVFD